MILHETKPSFVGHSEQIITRITFCISNIYVHYWMFMYKHVHNQVAHCVNQLFTRTNESHTRVIRHSDKLYIYAF